MTLKYLSLSVWSTVLPKNPFLSHIIPICFILCSLYLFFFLFHLFPGVWTAVDKDLVTGGAATSSLVAEHCVWVYV